MVISVSDKELEVKFFVNDLAEIEKQLVKLGATLVQPRTHEYNLRFDTPSGDLGQAESMLRLRRDAGSHVTFKGPSSTLGGVLARQEIEFEVSNFSAAQKLIEALGYRSKFVYEKFRTTYALDGLKITLDEMPYGPFVEIEGREAAAIQTAAKKLDLDWQQRLPETYVSIFRRLKELFSLHFTDLTFTNFEGANINMARVGINLADKISAEK
ncbi:MAG TPA: class IV adenylate cyclase [Anaerolineales bacterium]|jgi:adenylate cyclase class 2|nr:class IV adenylate cyclase [Anaerolineales bacterium]